MSKFKALDTMKGVSRLEIINAYQYDQKNLFSLQKIFFEKGIIDDYYQNGKGNSELIDFLKVKFGANFLELIRRTKYSVLCTMKQNRKTGFWQFLEPGPWAFLFPIIIDQKSILITFIVEENYAEKIKLLMEKLTKKYGSYEILAQTSFNVDEKQNYPSLFLFPKFTERQIEIASYAAQNGYFESPKQITAEDIAKHFGITISAVNDNLRKAEHTAMKFFFGNPVKWKGKKKEQK
ncbi:MAG: helix-turn-helix domain-containing protein [Promethearchaeota archaeon]